MMYFWYIIQFLIGYNLVLPIVLYILFRLAKRSGQKAAPGIDAFNADYAIIVTAYQEIAHIPETVQSILRLKHTNFICYVVLDNCSDISSLHFDDERIILLRPEQTLGGNVRSHLYAMRHFKRNHDYLTIIDSDNLVDEYYLDHLNTFFKHGFNAVQGLRAAKNLDSQYACLDAARDIYYHFYDGEVLFHLGSSATLSGSGMAFSVALYEECLGGKDVSGAGFDKVLQYEIIRRGNRIAFAEKAIVYDQKTSKSSQLVNQRARWINTWFRYFSLGFKLIGLGVRKASVNQFLFGIVLLRPPLFIFLMLSVLCLLVNLIVAPVLSLMWALSFLLFVLGFLLPLRGADKRIIKALKHIPSFMFYQVISLMHSRNANKRSVATKHFE
ncbi:glycosyltransferase [Niabella hibiscisoli]|uniref:glycosyltransferase n=1 Tax=Niabella hibiscisoli TaxID=1825928 RepID=UPI001F0FAE4B|nr:glycosyltransferase [Niabella hibiscisoli]MCH5720429.1 glycosyltransferase family 2 protein [Niabella hibiscisoli]